MSSKVSGIDASNLVKSLTSISTAQLVYDFVVDMLISKSHINSVMSQYEPTSEAPSFMAG